MTEQPVVLVTGASRGIGQYLSEHFISRDWTVVGCSRGQTDRGPHERYLHVTADVSNEGQVVAMFRRIRKDFGRLDCLLNCAAVNTALSLTAMLSYPKALETVGVNFLGTFLTCREAVKLMMRRNRGRIVNFGSMAVRHEVAGEAMYTAAKAAVCAFTRVLAKEVSAQGITCNVVAPSAIETELMAGIDPVALRQVLTRNAIQQLGTFQDVANAVDFLVRPESQAITGQILYLGGA